MNAFLRLLPPLLTTALLAQDGGSTFGHARARELTELGRLPSARDVVVRDLVNYHRHRLPLPKAGDDLALELRSDRGTAVPGDEVWLQVGYTTAPQGDRALAEPCAVALVIDTSGSMADAGKMAAVKAGLRAFVERLRDDDEVALVTFASEARVLAERRARGDGGWLRDAIERLEPGGNTNLHDGLLRGLDELAAADAGQRQRRVVLLTDGIANTGVTDPARIADDAAQHAGRTIDVSTIGVGQDLDTTLLQQLAQRTRGLFHFVADAADVQKVFVHEADALVAAVARDVHLTIEVPEDLTLLRVYDECATAKGNRVEVALPDLNAGVTGVVLLRCRLASGRYGDLRAAASVAYHSAARRTTVALRVSADLAGRDAATAALDGEVRRNAAIGVLAQGLADLAAACDARRWADADLALQRAGDDSKRRFPGDDADLQRVRDMVQAHGKTLRRYVDRFRDD